MSPFTRATLSATALVALIATGAAFAQDDPVEPGDPPVMDADEPAMEGNEPAMDAEEPAMETDLITDDAGDAPLEVSPLIEFQAANELLATEFLGHPVFNIAAENLGAIDNLLISVDGQLTGIVVGVGGFLGIGEKKVGIAIGAVQLMVTEEGETRFIVDLGRTALENAPDFRTFEQQQADIQAGNVDEVPAEEEPAQ